MGFALVIGPPTDFLCHSVYECLLHKSVAAIRVARWSDLSVTLNGRQLGAPFDIALRFPQENASVRSSDISFIFYRGPIAAARNLRSRSARYAQDEWSATLSGVMSAVSCPVFNHPFTDPRGLDRLRTTNSGALKASAASPAPSRIITSSPPSEDAGGLQFPCGENRLLRATDKRRLAQGVDVVTVLSDAKHDVAVMWVCRDQIVLEKCLDLSDGSVRSKEFDDSVALLALRHARRSKLEFGVVWLFDSYSNGWLIGGSSPFPPSVYAGGEEARLAEAVAEGVS